jgi:hypothetical protein
MISEVKKDKQQSSICAPVNTIKQCLLAWFTLWRNKLQCLSVTNITVVPWISGSLSDPIINGCTTQLGKLQALPTNGRLGLEYYS